MYRGTKIAINVVGNIALEPSKHAHIHTVAVEGAVTSYTVNARAHGLTEFKTVDGGDDVSINSAPLVFTGNVAEVQIVPAESDAIYSTSLTSNE